MNEQIKRVDVLGVGISAINLPMAVAEIGRWIDEREQHYVCVTGVHGVMECQNDAELMRIHNESGLTTPDGMPMSWCCWHAGEKDVDRVYGPDLMLALCEEAVERGWTSYFYGGREGIPELLAEKLSDRFPGLQVVGTWSPPHRPLSDEEDREVVARINDADPDLLWVGLSTPKQERWVADHIGKTNASALLAVGAAFDMHAGVVKQAPRWMQRAGLEWAFRIGTEPRRLWKRYASNNPRFVAAILRRRPHVRS